MVLARRDLISTDFGVALGSKRGLKRSRLDQRQQLVPRKGRLKSGAPTSRQYKRWKMKKSLIEKGRE
jgi:hypothetical protein